MDLTTRLPKTQQLIRLTERALQMGGFAELHCLHSKLFCTHLRTGFDYSNFRQRTGRAGLPLLLLQDLVAYNALYAAQHYTRFRWLMNQLQRLSSNKPSQPVNLKVVDYGCGQGLATLALLDHFRYRQVALELHLVEPSPLALFIAEHAVRAFGERMQGSVRVYPHCSSLDSLPDSLFAPTSTACLHLFSNVLDLVHNKWFRLARLLRQIKATPGHHLLLAISPSYPDGEQGFDALCAHLPGASRLIDSARMKAEVSNQYNLVSLQSRARTRTVQGRALALRLAHHPLKEAA